VGVARAVQHPRSTGTYPPRPCSIQKRFRK
jgi:hypothetical protein